MKNWMHYLRVPTLLVGFGLIFYAQRYLDGQAAGRWCLGGGVILLLVALVMSLFGCLKAQHSEERLSAKYLVLWQTATLVGLAVYFGYVKVIGQGAGPETVLGRVLLALWLGILIVGFCAGIGIEWAYLQSGRGRFAESRRVAKSGYAWLLVGLMLSTITALNYVAVKKDRSWDWSYLKTAKPSESTAKVLEALDQELRIAIFYPSTHEVLGQVKTYFDSLSVRDAKVKIEYYDAEIHPQAAESFRASRNGQIVFKYADANERLDLGANLSSARKTLRNLDAEVQKTLLVATQKKKVLYFTQGHGEFTWNGSDEDGLRSIKLFENFLRSQNYTLRSFGVSEGSTTKVPTDADGVVIVGGNSSMLPQEVSALKEYIEGGGGVVVLLDLDPPSDAVISSASRDVANDPLIKMLADFGVRFKPIPLANATNFVAGSKTEADSWFLFTNGFTSHESISSLARNDQRAALLTFRSGYLEITSEFNGWQNFETVRSLADSFADENKNFKYDDGKEKKNAYVQGVATIMKDLKAGATKKGKVVVLSDANAASDVLIRNQGNLVYLAEALRWISGSPIASAGAGVASSEEDVRIRHTRKEDIAWFYATVVLVPLIVIGIGYAATRRARRHR